MHESCKNIVYERTCSYTTKLDFFFNLPLWCSVIVPTLVICPKVTFVVIEYDKYALTAGTNNN